MKIFTTLPQNNLNLVSKAAAEAEQFGYDGLMTRENRHNPFLPLGVAATSTQSVTLMTNLAIAFPRSPMIVANLGWDLQLATNGRFVLGLGSQVRGHNERRFSVPWSPPAPRMREYISAVRTIWNCWESGKELKFRGEHYNFSLMTPAFTPGPLKCPPPAITMGAVGQGMLRVAAEVCDGVLLHPFCTKAYHENVIIPLVCDGLKTSGKKRNNFEIIGGGFIILGSNDQELADKINWVRKRIAFYGSTRAYWPVLRQHGLEDLGHKLYQLAKQGKWDAMSNEITDEIFELFTIFGQRNEIAKKISKRFEGLSDTVYVTNTEDGTTYLPAEIISQIHQLPTIFKNFSV